jgi:hypothetical protein
LPRKTPFHLHFEFPLVRFFWSLDFQSEGSSGERFWLRPAWSSLPGIGVASNATPGLRCVEIDGSGQFTEEKEVQRTR